MNILLEVGAGQGLAGLGAGAAAIGARRVVAVASAMEHSSRDGDLGPSRQLRAVLDTEVAALTGA